MAYEIAIGTCLIGEGARWLINPRSEPDAAAALDNILSTESQSSWRDKMLGVAKLLEKIANGKTE